ncbi:MAG: RraA family protein [Smithellaceae bacterium]|nr:RraA family protein [Smithellaceae bacterium]
MLETISIPKELAEMIAKATTGMINDALAILGLNGGIRGIRPARGFEDAKVMARATTVLFDAPRPDGPKLTMYQAIRNSAPGSILVIDGKGIDGHFTGDNQGECARRRGLTGIVVYGGARDIAGFREMGLPLYCTGSATIDKPADIQVVGHNVPIEIGGVTVRPGDIIIADEDGVVAIPQEASVALLEALQTIFEVEQAMEKAIQGNAPDEELRAIISRKKPKK